MGFDCINSLSLPVVFGSGRAVRWCWAKLPVPGSPTKLDNNRAWSCCASDGCGWGLFGHFSLVFHYSHLPPSLGPI